MFLYGGMYPGISKKIYQELFNNSYLWEVRLDVGYRETFRFFCSTLLKPFCHTHILFLSCN